MKGIKTIWTERMIWELTETFPFQFNEDIANSLGISVRTVIRKARELGLEKTPEFHQLHREEITKRMVRNKPPNPMLGVKGWSVPGSEKYQYQKGHIPATKDNPELMKRIHQKRNETIRRCRLRRNAGLAPLTKFKNLY